MRFKPLHLLLLAGCLLVLVWSGIEPHDRYTWVLEVLPAVFAMLLLIATYHRFRLTDMLYILIAVHAVVLMVGGHYTYARVPLGDWVSALLDLERNHYDRLGHFLQGFVPAVAAREVLLRLSPLRPGRWLNFIVPAICLAISACYEFLEWWTALLSEEAAQAFLGTQGDHWDTQWDMFLALVGAISAVALLSRWHDRQLERLKKTIPDFI